MPSDLSLPLPVDRSDWHSVPAPDLATLAVPGEDLSVLEHVEQRVDTWWYALQAAIGDSRRIRCERVWLHPQDLERLGEWVAQPLERAPRHLRDGWASEWIWSAPSASSDVPEGVVLIEDSAWEPPPSG